MLACALAIAACSDSTAPTLPTPRTEVLTQSEGRGVFQRYVAIGTSISMGWQSDGVNAVMQSEAWPAQLARLAGRDLDLPLISGTGCRAPLVAPLASGTRTNGEAAALPAAQAACAPLQAGVELPARNVAIAGARTSDALGTTPENQPDVFYQKLYSRILAPGQTQLTAALAQKPKFVSIELGANEVMGARSGIAIPGATIVPISVWAPQYTNLVGTVAREVKRGVLVGLIKDVATFPSFRRGAELYADRAAFLGGFHVEVSSDCENSQNLLFVAVRVPTAVATGLAQKARGLGPYVLRCADGGQGVQDFVLTPNEQRVVNAVLAEMNEHIAITARRNDFAIVYLEELFGRPDLKPPFSVVQFMTSTNPYGPLMSLDGIHPSGQGHAVLAAGAVRAINEKYGYGIGTKTVLAFGRRP
jgi:hypothetical protein